MSRMAVLFLIGAASGAAAGAAPTAEGAARRYHAMTAVAPAGRCAPGTGVEVVVCGRRDEAARYRLPLPEERAPRDGARSSGERPAASAAPVRQGGCGVADRGQICAGGFDGHKVGDAIVRIARALLDPDGIAEPEDFHPRPGGEKHHPESPLNPR